MEAREGDLLVIGVAGERCAVDCVHRPGVAFEVEGVEDDAVRVGRERRCVGELARQPQDATGLAVACRSQEPMSAEVALAKALAVNAATGGERARLEPCEQLRAGAAALARRIDEGERAGRKECTAADRFVALVLHHDGVGRRVKCAPRHSFRRKSRVKSASP